MEELQLLYLAYMESQAAKINSSIIQNYYKDSNAINLKLTQ